MKESIAINSVYIVMHEVEKLYEGTEHGYVWNVYADKREAEKEALNLNENYTGRNGNEDFFYVIEKTLW